MKTAVLGAGSWGTALASVLAWNNHSTTLWARSREIVNEITEQRTNKRYLSSAVLPDTMLATDDIERAVNGAELIVFAVPSESMSAVLNQVRPFIGTESILAHAVKGFDLPSKRRMTELMLDYLNTTESRLSVIAGPSHAEEVVAKMPTTIVVSGFSRNTAETVQDALMNAALRVYTNPDVVGTELGGTLKNIIALGVGIADGLGFGDNAKAALMTRGLAEITRLGLVMGASPLTFAGLSGVGDLIVTCTSRHSRNFRAGRLLGQGKTADETLREVGMAVEGVRTTKATKQIAAELNVEMPITEAIYEVLFESSSPLLAVENLMGRERNHEIEDVLKQDMSARWQIEK